MTIISMALLPSIQVLLPYCRGSSVMHNRPTVASLQDYVSDRDLQHLDPKQIDPNL